MKVIRNRFVLPMFKRHKKQIFKDKRQERGGDFNDLAEFLSEYEDYFVCEYCCDTHSVWSQLLERNIMCLRCPKPCDSCKDFPNPYCKETPCICDCHEKKHAQN